MEIDRRNLAMALEDEAARHAYLYPEKANPRTILRMILSPLRGKKKIFWMWLLHGLAFGIRPMLSVFVLGRLVRLLEQGATMERFLVVAALVAGLYFLLSAIVAQTDARIRATWMIFRVKLINRMLSQYMRMDFGLYENAKFLDVMRRWQLAFSGNETGLEGIWNRSLEGLGQLISALLLAGVLIGLLGPWMLVPLVVYLLVVYFTKANIARFQFAKSEALMQAQRRSYRYTDMATDFRYGKDTRLYRMQHRFAKGYQPILGALEKLYHAFTGRVFHMSFLENAGLILLEGTVFALLFWRDLPAVQFIPALTAGLLLSQALQRFAGHFLAFYQYESLYIEDAFTLLAADLQSEQGAAAIPGKGPVEIRLENVSFSYPGSDKRVLENCSLTLQAGESCALVGVNGAGKTTLVKLLTGLYRPTEGSVRINGVDATEIPADDLFRMYGVVFQDAQPLAVTIAEYVAASDEKIDRDRVQRSIEKAGLWEKVDSLDQGIDSPLLKVLHDDGVILSGGENQKLAIARALYRKDTRALILDEPTSALDALAEEKIYREFAELSEGRTTLFISHRLASTRFCDRIAVLSGGRIVEEGTHASLMKEDGLYRSLYETQAKYYRQEETA